MCALSIINPVERLAGKGAKRLWATSFSVDEVEAFALVHHLLGDWRHAGEAAWLSYDRACFRRAASGILPRKTLHPQNHDPGQTYQLPAYHPKLILVQSNGPEDCHQLLISSANVSKRDQRDAVNLGIVLEVSPEIAHSVIEWIEEPPRDRRAFTLAVKEDGSVKIADPASGTTFEQFLHYARGCGKCTGRDLSQWIVAAPFWSPGFLSRILKARPGSVTCYVRDRFQWDTVAHKAHRDRLGTITGFTFSSGDVWHHKLVGWRCCSNLQARSVVYIGSANATSSGFTGIDGQQVNWEAGVLLLGGDALWKDSKRAARGGMTPVRLGTPKNPKEFVKDDEVVEGKHDDDELLRRMQVHLANHIRVAVSKRTIKLCRAISPIRTGNDEWVLMRVELSLSGGPHHCLEEGQVRTIQNNLTATIFGTYVTKTGQQKYIRVEFPELDPAVDIPEPTKAQAISFFLSRLGGANNRKNHRNKLAKDIGRSPGPNKVNTDLRFPFPEVLEGLHRSPEKTLSWLNHIQQQEDLFVQKLPRHWIQIAEEITKDMS